jgi:type I restriction enzyme S subunit
MIRNHIWKNVSLGEFIELQRGFDLTASERIEGNIPVLGAAGLNGFHNEAKAKGPGIIVGRSGGSYGQVHLIKADFWPHNTAMFVKDFKGNDEYFTYYFLKNLDLSAFNSGSAQPSLNRNFIYPIRINIPEIDEQKVIAKFLSILDSKIELNNRINAELEAMAKTLYDFWFVQFDFPDTNGNPYKNSGGKMIWRDKLKREIPDGWEDGTLGDIAELVRGVTYDASEIKNENEDGVIPVLRATNISGNVIDLNNMVYVPKQNVSVVQRLNKFDIVITMSSGSKEHIGKNGFFYYEKEVSFGAFCAKIVAKDEFRFYLYSYTQSDFMFTTIKNECLGTNINNLNGSLVKGFRIVIPPMELIKSFNENVYSVYEKIGNNLMENQQLSSLRDWLLPMLMNGQVKVKDSIDNKAIYDIKEEINLAAEPESKNIN